jgi:hypothetical protein
MGGQASGGGGLAGSLDHFQQMDARVPDGRQNLRAGTLANPAAILAEVLVAHVVQPVLDPQCSRIRRNKSWASLREQPRLVMP